jgi:hypothetical protein
MGNLRRWSCLAAVLWLALPASSRAQSCATCPTGGGYNCGGCCQTHHCPPAFKWCHEGPPHICFRHGCPRPVCDPCNLPHFGYFETCWSPYPFPPNWSHCPTPPPAALVHLNPLGNVPPMMGPAGPPNPFMPTVPPTKLGPPNSVPNGSNAPMELPQPRLQSGPGL